MKVIVGDPAPIEGAEVLIDGASVGFTDATGSLIIPEVTTGSHTIEARKEGYSPDSAIVSVPETTSVTLTLTPVAPPTYTVSIHVTGSGPIAGASVYFDGAYVGLTNSAGSITIADVTAGSHTIRASKSGYYDASATISVPETTSVTLTLSPVPPAKKKTEVRLSSDKASYAVGDHAYITQGLYDEAGNLISGRVVDYTVTCDGTWYAGWGQYSDDPSRDIILSKAGTYVITGNFPGDDTYEPSSKSITITATAPPKISTRVDVWVRDFLPNKTARVCVLLEELVNGAWQPLPGKVVDVAVTDSAGAWYAGWGEYTGTSWACRGMMVEKSPLTFVVSFAGDNEYLPCSYTRIYEVPSMGCSYLLVEKGEWKPVTDPEGTRKKGEYYESQGLCNMDF